VLFYNFLERMHSHNRDQPIANTEYIVHKTLYWAKL